MASQILWRSQGAQRAIDQISITGTTRGSNGEQLFTLSTNVIGGIFAHSLTDGSERRLFHKQGIQLSQLCRHPTKDLVALAVQQEHWSSSIATATTEGGRLREITEGDSLDQAPAWVVGADETIVFQSAGLARNAHGQPVGHGPFRIEQLDLISGDMKTLLEDEHFDLLGPKKSADGALYFIRRPYQPMGKPISPFQLLLDFVLFPYRFIRALVYFFNFISMAFARKPLITSGAPSDTKPPTTMMLWGRMIDAEKMLKKGRGDGSTALVPRDWELVRRDDSGNETVIANGVAAFDLGADGRLVYSNGSVIFELQNGTPTELCRGRLISQISLC